MVRIARQFVRKLGFRVGQKTLIPAPLSKNSLAGRNRSGGFNRLISWNQHGIDARQPADLCGRGPGNRRVSWRRTLHWQGELLGTLFYVVGNSEDARDALQDTFVKCWRHRHELGEIENLKAWIFRVALNTGRDLRANASRRRRQPMVGELSMLATHDQSPGASLEQQEDLARLRQAIVALRAEEQEVFLLRKTAS